MRVTHELRGHSGAVRDAAATPNGKVVVTCSQDKTARVWDAAGACTAVLKEGHRGEVRACAVSADGGIVVTGGADNLLCVWMLVDSAAPVHTLKGHKQPINAVVLCTAGSGQSGFKDVLVSAGDGECRWVCGGVSLLTPLSPLPQTAPPGSGTCGRPRRPRSGTCSSSATPGGPSAWPCRLGPRWRA